MLNTAIIGCGPWGELHAKKIINHVLVTLFAIVEREEKKHKDIQGKYPGVHIFSNVTDLSLGETDCVIIATPISTHYELVKFFLQNNIHVFCEKPLCSTLEQARDLGRFLKPDLILQVGHSERFHHIWKTLKDDLAHTTGPYMIKIDRMTPFKDRAIDTGVVQDMMIHDLDLVRFLFPGLVIIRQEAHGIRQRTSHFDHVQAQLFFEDDSIATLTASRNHVKRKRSLEIICEQGTFWVDLINTRYLKALKGVKNPKKYIIETDFEKSDQIYLQQKAFFAGIRKEELTPVGYQEGVAAVELAQKICEQIND